MIPIQVQNLPDEYLFPVASLLACNRRFSSMIDLFAGDGTTLDYLSWYWNATPHALEIDPVLAQECAKRFASDGVVTCADMLSIHRPAAFDIAYAFPPYSNQHKIDISYLNHAMSFVRPGGVLIYAVYQTRFTFAQAAAIYKCASEVRAWTIPAEVPGDNLNIIVAHIDLARALGYDPNEIAMFTNQVQFGKTSYLTNTQSAPAFSIEPYTHTEFQN